MPNRIIREDLLKSRKFNKIDSESQNIYVRMLLKADDAGRLSGDIQLLMTSLFPYNNVGRNLSDMVKDLQKVKLIIIYTWKNEEYIQITNCFKSYNTGFSKIPWKDGSYEIKYVQKDTFQGKRFIVETSILPDDEDDTLPDPADPFEEVVPEKEKPKKKVKSLSPQESAAQVIITEYGNLLKRPGDDSSNRAIKNISNLIKEGETKERLLESIQKYQTEVKKKGVSPEYIYKVGNFFGKNRYYLTYLGAEESKAPEIFKEEEGRF